MRKSFGVRPWTALGPRARRTDGSNRPGTFPPALLFGSRCGRGPSFVCFPQGFWNQCFSIQFVVETEALQEGNQAQLEPTRALPAVALSLLNRWHSRWHSSLLAARAGTAAAPSQRVGPQRTLPSTTATLPEKGPPIAQMAQIRSRQFSSISVKSVSSVAKPCPKVSL